MAMAMGVSRLQYSKKQETVLELPATTFMSRTVLDLSFPVLKGDP